jgi:hypothetical protein
VDLWVGPAIIAALVSALVSALGWFVTSWQTLRLEARRRAEKVRDFQVALRAEIASDLLVLQVGERADMLDDVANALTEDPLYQPFVPRMAQNAVFEQIIKEIHILPGRVIDAVIDYQRLRQSVDYFIADIRDAKELSSSRRLLMIADYFEMLDRLEVLAGNAVTALDVSLSKPGAVLPTRASASGRASAPQSVSSEGSASP